MNRKKMKTSRKHEDSGKSKKIQRGRVRVMSAKEHIKKRMTNFQLTTEELRLENTGNGSRVMTHDY